MLCCVMEVVELFWCVCSVCLMYKEPVCLYVSMLPRATCLMYKELVKYQFFIDKVHLYRFMFSSSHSERMLSATRADSNK
jgi:hypothetical protein